MAQTSRTRGGVGDGWRTSEIRTINSEKRMRDVDETLRISAPYQTLRELGSFGMDEHGRAQGNC